MTDVAKEIEHMQEMTTPELVARYEVLWGKTPRVRNPVWLRKRCAWKLQEIKFGGLSTAAKKVLEELIAEIDFPLGDEERTVTGKLAKRRRPGDPAVGTTLTREWKGRELRLRVLEDGYELDGVVHASLSAAARAATGSKWNGPLFWNLTKRGRR
jgi:hypothetical protein